MSLFNDYKKFKHNLVINDNYPSKQALLTHIHEDIDGDIDKLLLLTDKVVLVNSVTYGLLSGLFGSFIGVGIGIWWTLVLPTL